MKWKGKAVLILAILAAMAVSFFAGGSLRSQAYNRTCKESRIERCGRYITLAIDTITNKGLSLKGASDAAASNIWVAHEFCDDPAISAELSDLWNCVVYGEDREEVIVTRLQDILEQYR